MNFDNTEVTLVAMACLAGGIAAIYGAYRKFVAANRIKDTPTSEIGELTDGFREIKGRIIKGDKTLHSPMSGTQCVYYEFTVTESHEDRSKEIISEKKSTRCYLDDGTGIAAIELDGAELVLDVDYHDKSGTFNSASPELEKILKRYGESSKGLLFNKELKYEETILEAGDELYVLGPAQMVKGSICFKADRGQSLIVSDKSERELLQKHDSKSLLSAITGVVLFVIAGACLANPDSAAELLARNNGAVDSGSATERNTFDASIRDSQRIIEESRQSMAELNQQMEKIKEKRKVYELQKQQRQKDFEKATANLKKKYDTKSGNALRAQGKMDEAIDAYKKAIELNPNYAGAHYNLGNALRDQEKPDEAIDAYKKAIELNPNYAEAHCNLGHVLKRQRRFTEALRYLERGHELGSKNPQWKYPSARWVDDVKRQTELPGLNRKASSANWPQAGFGAAQTRFNPHESTIDPSNVGDLEVLWSNRHGSSIRGFVSIIGETAYYGDYGGEFRAVEAATGQTVWRERLQGKHQGHAIVGSVAYVTSINRLFAFDAATGKTLWTKDPDSGHFGGPTVEDGIVYVGTHSPPTLHALNASTGDELWNVPGGRTAVADGVLYKSSAETLQALDAKAGTELWKVSIEEGELTGPVVSGNVVYVHSTVGNLYAFDARDRKAQDRSPLWIGKTAIQTKGDGTRLPAVGNGKVFVGANSTFYAFDTTASEKAERNPVWTTEVEAPFIAAAPSVANGVVYSAAGNHDIYAFDAATGKVLWNHRTPGREYPMRSSPTIVNGRLFHADTFGFTLYAFHIPEVTDRAPHSAKNSDKPTLKTSSEAVTSHEQPKTVNESKDATATISKLPRGDTSLGDKSPSFTLYCNGTSSHVVIPTLKPDWTASFTVEAWVRPRILTGSREFLCDAHGAGLAFGFYGGVCKFLLHDGRTYQSVRALKAAVPAKEIHVAGVFDGDHLNLFVEGKRQGAGTAFTGRAKLSPLPLHIGANPEINHPVIKVFSGTIDEVCVSNVARYQSDFTPSRRLKADAHTLALYHFDEPNGRNAFDSSANKRHGQIQSASHVEESSPTPFADDSQVSAVSADGSRKSVAYQPFLADVWRAKNQSTQLFPWEGEQVVFLTTTDDLDPKTMAVFVKRLDAVWKRCGELVGQSPYLIRPYEGKVTIAAVPDASFTINTGTGFGFGPHGMGAIEVAGFYGPQGDYERVRKDPESFPDHYFLLIGQNHSVPMDRLNLARNGSALLLRQLCNEEFKLSPSEAQSQKAVEHFENSFAQSTATFAEAFPRFGAKKPVPIKDIDGNAIAASDLNLLFASCLLKVRKDNGGDAYIKRFYRHLSECPQVVWRQYKLPGIAKGQVLNWVVAASLAAGKDLSPSFRDRWRFPLEPEVWQALKSIDWKKPGLASVNVFDDLPFAQLPLETAIHLPAFLTPERQKRNLIIGGTFEDGSDGTWKGTTWRRNKAAFAVVSNEANHGQNSVLIRSLRIADDARYEQTVSVKTNTQYLVSGWIKTKDVVVVEKGGKRGATISIGEVSSRSFEGTNGWSYVTLVLDSHRLNEITVRARLGFRSSTATGEAWFDDLCMIPLSPDVVHAKPTAAVHPSVKKAN